MARSTITKDTWVGYVQFTLPSAITISGGGVETVLNNVDIKNYTSVLSTIPSNKNVVGVVFCWGSGSYFIAVDTVVWSERTVTIKVLNVSSSSQTITNIRLLVIAQ